MNEGIGGRNSPRKCLAPQRVPCDNFADQEAAEVSSNYGNGSMKRSWWCVQVLGFWALMATPVLAFDL